MSDLFTLQLWCPSSTRKKLNNHVGILKEFSVTFMEALKMIRLGIRLWSYVREEASHGRRALIDPFNHEGKPTATQGWLLLKLYST